jgi:hypothetical protein
MMGAHTGAFVIDLLTVTELVACEAESALAVIGQPFIAQSAVGTLSTMLDEARHERSAGRLYEQNGQMAFIEQTEPDRKRRIDFLDRLNQCVKMYCRPTPVYGPERIPDDIRKLYPLLDTESLDAILLSLEQQAVLLTLDGRLRELSTRFGQIPGVWPQVLMQHALASGAISATTYSYALLRHLGRGSCGGSFSRMTTYCSQVSES